MRSQFLESFMPTLLQDDDLRANLLARLKSLPPQVREWVASSTAKVRDPQVGEEIISALIPWPELANAVVTGWQEEQRAEIASSQATANQKIDPQALELLHRLTAQLNEAYLQKPQSEWLIVRDELYRLTLDLIPNVDNDLQATSAVGWALGTMSRADFHLGIIGSALELSGRSLTLMQVLRETVGDQPEVLRDLSVSLDNTANVLKDLGDSQGALERYERSLLLREQVRGILGDQPQTLRDLSISLANTANVLLRLGDSQGALERYERSLLLGEQVRGILGDQPQTLRDISVSLNKTADVLLGLGDSQGALERYERSLLLREQVRGILGDQPQTLRDISVSLDNTANVLLRLGDSQGALERYERSLLLSEQVRGILGDQPQTLRDKSVSLNKTADVLLRLGDSQGALERYERSLLLSEQVRGILGDQPQTLRDLAISHIKLSQVTIGQDKVSNLRVAKELYLQMTTKWPQFSSFQDELSAIQGMIDAVES